MEWVLWGLVLYGSLWFLLKGYRCSMLLRYEPAASHLVVVTRNNQSSIEWVIRSFFFWSWLSGRTCQVSCLDTGSSDDTLVILEAIETSLSLDSHPLCSGTPTGGADDDRGGGVGAGDRDGSAQSAVRLGISPSISTDDRRGLVRRSETEKVRIAMGNRCLCVISECHPPHQHRPGGRCLVLGQAGRNRQCFWKRFLQ